MKDGTSCSVPEHMRNTSSMPMVSMEESVVKPRGEGGPLESNAWGMPYYISEDDIYELQLYYCGTDLHHFY